MSIASFTGTVPFARLRALIAEARSMLSTLRALAAGRLAGLERLEFVDASGNRSVYAADGYVIRAADGSHVEAWVGAGEAYVLAATAYDGDVIRAADDECEDEPDDLDVAS